jgi:hypothetical protein
MPSHVDEQVKKILFKALSEAAQIEKDRVESLSNKANFSKKESKKQNAGISRTISGVYDCVSKQVYTATSSSRPQLTPTEIHPILKNKIPPSGSLEAGRPPEVCAEFKACNLALYARKDARLEDLIVATVMTKDMSNKTRCANCLETTDGTTVITDNEYISGDDNETL